MWELFSQICENLKSRKGVAAKIRNEIFIEVRIQHLSVIRETINNGLAILKRMDKFMKKGISIKSVKKNTYGITQNMMVQPHTGRH